MYFLLLGNNLCLQGKEICDYKDSLDQETGLDGNYYFQFSLQHLDLLSLISRNAHDNKNGRFDEIL